MRTHSLFRRIAGAGALAALVFTAACDTADSTGPEGLAPPELAFSRQFVEAGAIYVCQFTEAATEAEYSFASSGDAGSFTIVGTVPDGWDGDPVGQNGCALVDVSTPRTGFAVTLESPATFVHESGGQPNRWFKSESSFGNFLFETSYRDDLGTGQVPINVGADQGLILWYKFTLEDVPPPSTGVEGCTPGAWRNQDGTRRNGRNRWTGTPYDLTTTFEDVFGEGSIGDAGLTLREALDINSNRGGRALLKHAAAAALNAAHEDVDYPYTLEMVVDMFNEAWSDLEADDNETKDTFDEANNLGCPI